MIPSLWGPEEDKYLVKNLGKKMYAEIGEKLGRSIRGIENRVDHLRKKGVIKKRITKKERIKRMIQRHYSRRRILREVGTSYGYLYNVMSELRSKGMNIPKLKAGRPRKRRKRRRRRR